MAPGANPTVVTRNEYGGRVSVVSFVALGKYRVNGTINAENMVQRVQTWVPNPVVGDLYYENVYTNYRDIGGVKIPAVPSASGLRRWRQPAECQRRRPCVWSGNRLGRQAECGERRAHGSGRSTERHR